MSPPRVFLDTNILVYTLDIQEPEKQKRAADLIVEKRSDIVIATQVLVELHAVCTRKLHLSSSAARDVVAGAAKFPVVGTDRRLVGSAMDLAAAHQLSIFDAMIVAAAQRGGCVVLYTEDLNPGQRFGELVVENPFAI